MSRPDTNQQVNMICRAVDNESGSVHFPDDAPEVREQISAEVSFDQRAPTPRREDKMQQDIAQSVGHVSSAPPGLVRPVLAAPHGLRRGLHSFAASRLDT
jgi:hypothetical protein